MKQSAALALVLVLTSGCPKKRAEAFEFTWEETPRLPSPSAGTYARAPAMPPDPPLAELVKAHRWDASLGGAAAGVALALIDSPSVPNWQVRHEAWRAGYPYPINTLSVWHGPIGSPPPDGVAGWLERAEEDGDIGLVRARHEDGDTWVGLAATPRASVGVQPRQLPEGASFTLPPIANARFLIADSDGDVHTGTLELPQTFTVDAPGEWIIKITDDVGVVARFPLYVGTTPPMEPVVGFPTSGDPQKRTRALIDEIRATHNKAPYTSDLLFEAAARRQLQPNPLDKAALASRLGWPADRLTTWDVQANSIAEAMDRILWEPASRPALMAEGASVGIAAEDTDRGVHVVVLVGFDG